MNYEGGKYNFISSKVDLFHNLMKRSNKFENTKHYVAYNF